MMPERNLYSKGVHDDDGNKNGKQQCLFKNKTTALQVNNPFFCYRLQRETSNVTFYVIDDVTIRTTNFLSRFHLQLII